jgi:hypothetical protein
MVTRQQQKSTHNHTLNTCHINGATQSTVLRQMNWTMLRDKHNIEGTVYACYIHKQFLTESLCACCFLMTYKSMHTGIIMFPSYLQKIAVVYSRHLCISQTTGVKCEVR